MKRRFLLALGVAVLAPQPLRAQTPPPASTDPLELLWTRPLTGVVELAVSADGSHVLAADRDGVIRCFDERGQPRWQATLPGVNRLRCCSGGRLTVAFALRQPLHRQVLFLGPEGEALQTLDAPGPVISAALSEDGTFAAVASGKSLFFASRDRRGFHLRTVRLKDEPFQLEMGPEDTVYVAYASPPRVELTKSTGRVLWTHSPREGAIRALCASADGRRLALAASMEPSRRALRPNETQSVEITLLDWRNSRHWSEVRPGRSPRVRMTAGGEVVLLSYEHQISHQADRLFERRLAYLAGPGRPTWTKGGGYTAPVFIAAGSEGEWVVALDSQREAGTAHLRLYGPDGGRLWMLSNPADVLIATAAHDGRHLAVYRTDGAIALLRVNVRGPQAK